MFPILTVNEHRKIALTESALVLHIFVLLYQFISNYALQICKEKLIWLRLRFKEKVAT